MLIILFVNMDRMQSQQLKN